MESTRGADVDPATDTCELLARARAGDPAALNQLFEQHVPRLKRWASGRLPGFARDLTETSDLVQDTVIGTMRRLHAFEPRRPGALDAYLRQAVINKVRQQIRRVARRPVLQEIGPELPDGGASPLAAAIGDEVQHRYERALQRLEPLDRLAVITRVELGMSYADVADVLHKPSPDAARMTVARALVRLAEQMERAAVPLGPDVRA